MNVSLFQAAAALNANSRWQEAIAENLASSGIPGFKKQELSFGAIQGGLMKSTSAETRYSLPSAKVMTNFRAGEMKSTGNPTDVAIEGPGFFEVQLPNGTRALTRDGEFQQNAQGQLTTKQGYLVMSSNGPVQFDPGKGGPISISSTGAISQGSDFLGQIKVVDVDDPQALTSLGSGFFLSESPKAKVTEVPFPSLRAGYLENANTSTSAEMVNLISAMRQYEANQRLIQNQDERMGRVISELGNPS
ncbi:MAG: flagellar hook basal-body protein [Verrucomicrobia bacterium]|nr:flagellar hook basal-body protein [Verrucomicrobiota bacterium]